MTRAGTGQVQAAVFAGLLAVAAVAWWLTALRMRGMTAGPGTNLGTVGWFTVTWAVMMAAMMLPSLAPAAAASTAVAPIRLASRTVLFAGGYLLVWTLAGFAVYGLLAVAKRAAGVAWTSEGHWLSGGVLLSAAMYELTRLKRVFLARCRRPPANPPSRGRSGATAQGMSAGVCCLGCSWALMAALFALGLMSLNWMALVAALVAIEKLAPWPRAGTVIVATVLAAIALGVAAFPRSVPGLREPDSHGSSTMMSMTRAQQ
jgi:predicted metal-binding membrane protein